MTAMDFVFVKKEIRGKYECISRPRRNMHHFEFLTWTICLGTEYVVVEQDRR